MIAESAPASTLRLKLRISSAAVARLRVVLGVAGDLDVEPVAGLLADEGDELVGVAELAGGGEPRRQVAAQRDDVADAVRLVPLELGHQVGAGGGDAGDVRRGLVARRADLEHGLERALAGRPARAEGAREELGLQLPELLPRRAQLFLPLRRLGREELEAERLLVLLLRLHLMIWRLASGGCRLR